MTRGRNSARNQTQKGNIFMWLTPKHHYDYSELISLTGCHMVQKAQLCSTEFNTVLTENTIQFKHIHCWRSECKTDLTFKPSAQIIG